MSDQLSLEWKAVADRKVYTVEELTARIRE